MTAVAIEIVRFVDEHQPGFVECRLIDAQGQSHTFLEKVPIVTEEKLWSGSKYPRAGSVACRLEAEFKDTTGRLLSRIDTAHPFSVESASGETKFIVLSSQLDR